MFELGTCSRRGLVEVWVAEEGWRHGLASVGPRGIGRGSSLSDVWGGGKTCIGRDCGRWSHFLNSVGTRRVGRGCPSLVRAVGLVRSWHLDLCWIDERRKESVMRWRRVL